MWNVNGLVRKINDVDFLDILDHYDLILLSETWISNKHTINLDIKGFESYHIFGQKTRGVKKEPYSGGLSVYFRSEFKIKIRNEIL